MFTLGTHFDKLLQNLQPPQERLDAARDLPGAVREYLADHQDFPTVYPHTRLVGSYAQGMSVVDVKDVDFLVRVDGDPEENDPEARALVKDLKSALDDLLEALGYEGWAGIDIERARRSVHVCLKGRDFHLDVVPCIAPDGFDEPIYVPDRGFNKWIASHPVGFVALLNELDVEHQHKMKKLGKLLKHFRNVQMKSRKPKSYWLGSLLVHQVRDEELDTSDALAVVFRNLLDGIYKKYACLLPRTDGATPCIKDPLLGHDISWNWSRTHFETFMRTLDDGRKWATDALEQKDRAEAVRLWQKVFGEEYFPTEVEEGAKSWAGWAGPGKSVVTSSGLVLPTAPSAGVFTPTRPTTFHGAEE